MQEEISLSPASGCDVVNKDDKNATPKVKNLCSLKEIDGLKLCEKLISNYEDSFLNSQELSTNKKHCNSSENLEKKKTDSNKANSVSDDVSTSSKTMNLSKDENKRQKSLEKNNTGNEILREFKKQNDELEIQNYVKPLSRNTKNLKENFNNIFEVQATTSKSNKVLKDKKTHGKCLAKKSSNSENLKELENQNDKIRSQDDGKPLSKSTKNLKRKLNNDLEMQATSSKATMYNKIKIKKSIKCNLCSRGYSHQSNLDRHVKIVHKQLKPFQCEDCNFRCHQKYFLDKHIDLVHKNLKPFTCVFCNHKAGLKENMLNHVNAVHKNLKRYSCNHCEDGFSSKRYLINHLERIHKQPQTNGNYLEIQNCVKPVFIHIKRLKEHLNTDLKMQPPKNVCDKCNVTFSSRSILNRHNRDVHNKKQHNFECDQCDYKCFYHFKLVGHMYNVHKIKIKKSFKCDLCSKEYSDKSTLNRHIKVVHKQLKPIQCKQCNFRCHQNYILDKHVDLVHKKLKPFKCSFCNHETGLKENMLAHINYVHKKLKRYPCSHCDKGFSTKHRLIKHLESIHNLPQTKPTKRQKRK